VHLFNVLAQASLDRNFPWGWVIAAWVLGCRARFADSSVKTTRDSLWDRH